MNDLPPSIQTLIADVVRRTRLWRFEKLDVRAELESHFREAIAELKQDGLPADGAARRTAEEFGDPRLTARLIRRGKKRGRPMMWKLFVRTTVCLVFCFGATAAYAGWLVLGQPSPSVDYVAKLNEPLERIPLEDRAWPVLRQALIDLTPMPPELSEHRKSFPSLTPADPRWAQAMEWVNANRPLLGDIRKAAQRRAYGYVYDNREARRFTSERQKRRHPNEAQAEETEPQEDPLSPRMISVLLPSLADVRDVCRLLVLEARAQAAAGDFAAAWDALETSHRLGILLFGGFTLIEQLVGAAILDLTMDAYAKLLQEGASDLPRHAQRLQDSFLPAAPLDVIRPNMSCERYFFEDVVQYLFTDDGHGDGFLIPSQFAILRYMIQNETKTSQNPIFEEAALIGAAAVHAGRKETMARFDQLWARMEKSLSFPLFDPNRQDFDKALEKLSQDTIERRRFALLVAMLPSIQRADQLIREAAMHQAAAQAVLALHLYRIEQDEFPESLEALLPEYLPSLPVDAWSGEPLRYARGQNGDMLLYSIWRNEHDDAGSTEDTGACGDADRVYWPPRAR